MKQQTSIAKQSLSYPKIGVRQLYILSFILPIICMSAVYILFKVFPFGDKTVLVMDLNGQYADFFAYYHRVLTGGDSLLYSFSKEMGGNVFGLFAYYLSSPFFLLAAFFPMSAMPEGIAIITLLKIGCCGLTFAFFIKNKFKRADMSILIFSCAYALMTYSMHYSMCIMWLDGAIWLPVILLGTEYIINNKSGILFLFAYTMSLISNYYTAYMNTVFTVIYFFFCYFWSDNKKNAKDLIIKTLKMAGFGFMGILISISILLPTFIDIFNGKMSSGSYTASGFWNQDIFNILRRLFPGQYDTITNAGMPNIFCGMICGAAGCTFFFNSKISIKKKIAAAIVFMIFIASFFIKKVDIAWHIFMYPNWYPYRYAYTFCCFAVMIAYVGFSNTEKSNIKPIGIGLFMYFILLLAIAILKKSMLKNIAFAIVGIILLAIYIALIILYIKNSTKTRKAICCAILIITCCELIANGYLTISGLNKEHKFISRSEYSQKVNDIKEFTDFLKNDEDFYRAEKTFSRTDNDSMSFGYNGMTHYSSTYNNNIRNFNKNMGMLQEYVLIRYMGSTIITDSLLGVKYVASENIVHDDYTIAKTNDTNKIYTNPYALPLIFSAPKSALDNINYGASPLENQNIFAKSILQNSYVNKQNSMLLSNNQISFNASSSGTYYAVFEQKYEKDINLSINRQIVNYPYDDEPKKIFCLGKFANGDNILLTLSSADIASKCKIYSVDTEAFEKDCLELKNSGIDIEKQKNTYIKGQISVNNDNIIFTTIPYEKGWSAYIDSKKAETVCAQNTFLAVKADNGTHTLVLKYRVPMLIPSLIISLCALTAAIIITLKLRKKEITNEYYNKKSS